MYHYLCWPWPASIVSAGHKATGLGKTWTTTALQFGNFYRNFSWLKCRNIFNTNRLKLMWSRYNRAVGSSDLTIIYDLRVRNWTRIYIAQCITTRLVIIKLISFIDEKMSYRLLINEEVLFLTMVKCLDATSGIKDAHQPLHLVSGNIFG